MLYAIVGLIALASIGFGIYATINKSELVAQIAALKEEVDELDAEKSAEIDRLKREVVASASARQKERQEQIERHSREVDALKAELAKLDKLRRIPDVIERSRKLEEEIAARLSQAQLQADEAVLLAHQEIEKMKVRSAAKLTEADQRADDVVRAARQEALKLKQSIIAETNHDATQAKEARRIAESQAAILVEEAGTKAKEIASQARKEAKEKLLQVDEALARAAAYALETRQKAETRAKEIAGQAYDALKRYEFYDQAARAKQNMIEGYSATYVVPASHLLDELAEEYGFHKAGERLKVARDYTRVMEKRGLAATCNYPEGWKRDYAVAFVLSAFNGRVDSILARLKPANQGRLIQEIKDVYAVANHNGEVFKNARIHEEYLEARLEELKWAVAVQRVKERARDEQRAIREQLKEEQKAKKEYERALKQAEREVAALAKRMERARQEFATANAQAQLKYEAERRELEDKLRRLELEAEQQARTETLRQIQEEKEKHAQELERRQHEYETQVASMSTKLSEYENKKRALSLAQQTKVGFVYVISNIGSFGEDVFKIGLTRRLDPLDRVRELGDASVPFSFDVHALIRSDDAPALEADLHRRFLSNQVNKVNRRKEFFRLKLHELRNVVDGLAPNVQWTMAAEARDYRESLAMERQLEQDPEFRRRWAESEAAYEADHMFDDDEMEQEADDVAVMEETV